MSGMFRVTSVRGKSTRTCFGIALNADSDHLWGEGETGGFSHVCDVLFLKPECGTWDIIMLFILLCTSEIYAF